MIRPTLSIFATANFYAAKQSDDNPLGYVRDMIEDWEEFAYSEWERMFAVPGLTHGLFNRPRGMFKIPPGHTGPWMCLDTRRHSIDANDPHARTSRKVADAIKEQCLSYSIDPGLYVGPLVRTHGGYVMADVAVPSHRGQIRDVLQRAKDDGYKFVVIDSGTRLENDGVADGWACNDVAYIASHVGIDVYFEGNQHTPTGKRISYPVNLFTFDRRRDDDPENPRVIRSHVFTPGTTETIIPNQTRTIALTGNEIEADRDRLFRAKCLSIVHWTNDSQRVAASLPAPTIPVDAQETK